jgi:aspartyl-tRNA(Asn)/glutamyl-tRNA(Gln) amidotransferase subunit C
MMFAMSQAITDQEIEHLKKLARIEMNAEDTARAKSDINKVLSYFEKLQQLDTTGLPEMPRPVKLENIMREDVATAGFSQAEALELGVSVEDGFFKVPRTVE